jgi:GT2 family glycosyltransferase
MPFFNRRKQFIKSLETIKNLGHQDIEVVVVDDASNEEDRIADLPGLYPFLRTFRIEAENKACGSSPVIPYNMAIKESKGEKIIITNPECAFVGDIIQYVKDHVNDSQAVSFGCFSLSEELSESLFPDGQLAAYETINDLVSSHRNVPGGNGQLGWYNHSQIRPAAYHFCNAFTRNTLIGINGFDERYAGGICFDDDDLLFRVRQAGCNVPIVDDPFVLHQYHCSAHVQGPVAAEAFQRNCQLYSSITSGSIPKWDCNIKGIINAE